MKILINITESYYNACKRLQKQGIAQVAEAIIATGKPYEERPQGEWIDDNEADSYYANCSCCGYQIDTHYECGYLNFCPNCGADMRGGRE